MCDGGDGRKGREGRELPGVSPKATYGLAKLWLWQETISARMSACASVPLASPHSCASWQMSCKLHDFVLWWFFFFFFWPSAAALLRHYTFGSICCRSTGEGCGAVRQSLIALYLLPSSSRSRGQLLSVFGPFICLLGAFFPDPPSSTRITSFSI